MKLSFGKLTLAVPVELRNGKRYLLCRCECGREAWIREDKLEQRQSCGCEVVATRRAAEEARRVASESPKKMRPERISDHLRQTHSSWSSMRKRCRLSGRCKAYRYYVGISVCERWASFSLFLADVGQRPSPKHTLDRYPDRRGNYEPGNVRWATHKEQQNNRNPRRSRVVLTSGDEQFDAKELAKRTGLKLSTVRGRISSGWDAARILATPLVPPGQRHLLPRRQRAA